MAKFATALVLVSLVAVAMAGDGPYHSGGYKAKAYHQPAPYMKAKSYESSYVPQKKAYNVPSYDMSGYASGSQTYYQKKQSYTHQQKASNYGAHHGSTYQKKAKVYPRY